jgi:tetratricopeptide (TPR) repeat protein
MKAMKSETVKNAAISTLVGATLVAGVITLAPRGGGEGGPRPAPGPAARGMAAVGAGAPASLAELTALIGDRERWLRAHPGDEVSWAVLGAAYTERGRWLADAAYYPRAESALRRSLGVLPASEGNVDALVGLAGLANARHDFAAARSWGESARKQKPKRWTVYPSLIDAYHGLGDYPAARKALATLQELRPGAQTMGRTAQNYRYQGWREDAAAAAYNAVAAADTPAEKAAALHRMGELSWERGEPAEAMEQYDAALKLVRDHHPSLAGRARTLAALGRTDEAFRDYQAALERAALPEYALEAGELYESLGLDGDAATRYKQLRATAQAAGVNHALVLGLFEADHGDADEAVRLLEAEWARNHRSMYVADALGWALHRAGRAREALPYAKLATGPGLRSALFSYHRGEIERSLDQLGPARRHLAEALRINPYFSPLLAPVAKDALEAVGEPPEGGPKKVSGEEALPVGTAVPPLSPSPSPSTSPSSSLSPHPSPSLPPSPSLSGQVSPGRAGGN